MDALEKPLVIQTEWLGCALRQFIPEDAAPLFALIDRNRQHLSQWGDTTAQKYPDFKSVLTSITNPLNPERYRFGTWNQGQLVGTINLTCRSERTAEVGYWIGSEFCKQGFARIATAALVSYAFTMFDLEYIVADVQTSNLASQTVLKRAGFLCGPKTPDTIRFSIKRWF